ncbi:MAG: hypothetical protein PVI97_18255 [Candidatus Thiodiazotropha sp.]|jgi:hypothetical protein
MISALEKGENSDTIVPIPIGLLDELHREIGDGIDVIAEPGRSS